MSLPRPLRDIIFVRRESEDELEGRFIIPATARKKKAVGIVVAVGNGEISKGKRIPMSVKPGDRIVWNGWIGEEFECDGEKLIAMHEFEVDAILDDEVQAKCDKFEYEIK